jgi:hypothetical protein
VRRRELMVLLGGAMTAARALRAAEGRCRWVGCLLVAQQTAMMRRVDPSGGPFVSPEPASPSSAIGRHHRPCLQPAEPITLRILAPSLPPSPSPSPRGPNPTMTIPTPATSRPAPARGATAGWRWMHLVRWRRHWRTAWGWRRGPGGHSLSMSDNGKSHDCKRRQDSSSMYHGIL